MGVRVGGRTELSSAVEELKIKLEGGDVDDESMVNMCLTEMRDKSAGKNEYKPMRVARCC
jgi:hypothetical protein